MEKRNTLFSIISFIDDLLKYNYKALFIAVNIFVLGKLYSYLKVCFYVVLNDSNYRPRLLNLFTQLLINWINYFKTIIITIYIMQKQCWLWLNYFSLIADFIHNVIIWLIIHKRCNKTG